LRWSPKIAEPLDVEHREDHLAAAHDDSR